MKRVNWRIAALWAQAAWSVCFAIAVFTLATLLIQSHGKPDGADESMGLKIGLATVAPILLMLLASLYGLWKTTRWGWWSAVTLDFTLSLIFIYSIFDDGWDQPDLEMFVFTALSLVPPVLLLLPRVKSAYLKKPQAPPENKGAKAASGTVTVRATFAELQKMAEGTAAPSDDATPGLDVADGNKPEGDKP